MNQPDREKWILDWMKDSHERVDVLYATFVRHYVKATGAKSILMPFGADKCRQLGADLSRMHKAGILSRHATGLSPGDSSMGFPRWVYVYSLKNTP